MGERVASWWGPVVGELVFWNVPGPSQYRLSASTYCVPGWASTEQGDSPCLPGRFGWGRAATGSQPEGHWAFS